MKNRQTELPILMLTHNYPRYQGDQSGVFLSVLAKKLVTFGLKPIVLAPHDNGTPEYEQVDGLKIYRFGYGENEDLAYNGDMQRRALQHPIKFWRFLRSFYRAALEIIEKEKIAVIWGHWLLPAGIIMKRLARRTSLPMVLSSHGTDIRLLKKYRWLLRPYFRRFWRELRNWTVVSNYLKDEVIALLPGNRLSVMPLPHDEAVFYKDETITRQDNLVVSVTRFTEQKRVNYLLNAFALVIRSRPEARLRIYGSGSLQQDVEWLVSDLALTNHVEIMKSVSQNELRTIYNEATVVVLNSYKEGFGLTLSEAMMCGAAVIGTDSGGIPDIIEHWKTGILVPVDDMTELAASIVELLEYASLRERLAANGYRVAHEKYASMPLAQQYSQMIGEQT